MRQLQQQLNRELAPHLTTPPKKQVRLLQILADGCKKHPAHRAIRRATGRCAPCVRMWGARFELTKLQS